MRYMTSKQISQVESLIRKECCNYDGKTKTCIKTDKLCPQRISQRIICPWFKEAVLPLDKDLYAEVIGIPITNARCIRCHKPIRIASNRQKYCPECAKTLRQQKQAEWKRRQHHPEG